MGVATNRSRPVVVIIGGGYGGATLAKLLDEWAEPVLIDAKDAMFHSVGALRALVDPGFASQVFFPYNRLLTNGRFVRGRVVEADADGVLLADGTKVEADYIVLASGSTYPFPAKVDVDDSAAALEKIASARAALKTARRVLIVGGGPVGIELAGEISDGWPDKQIALVEIAPVLVPGRYSDGLRAELRTQLATRGVALYLGSALEQLPPVEPATSAPIRVSTMSGETLEADMWFHCFGVNPASEYLRGTLAAAQNPDGTVRVDQHLRVEGHATVFALGDITAVPEPKRAGAAQRHAPVVAANIKALADGGSPETTHAPLSPPLIVPIGRHGGASEIPTDDGWQLVGADETSARKGRDLHVPQYRTLFGMPEPTVASP